MKTLLHKPMVAMLLVDALQQASAATCPTRQRVTPITMYNRKFEGYSVPEPHSTAAGYAGVDPAVVIAERRRELLGYAIAE
jgi:hypothetical protein